MAKGVFIPMKSGRPNANGVRRTKTLKIQDMMVSKVKKTLSIAALAVVLSLSAGSAVQAQCPMCRMSAESNLENGGTEGRGLNTGILYMLAMPYLLVGALGYIWWRNRRKAYDQVEN